MTSKLETVVFAQGWLDTTLEQIAGNFGKSQDTGVQEAGAQITEMWGVVNTAVDELILENETLRAKLELAQNALR